MALFQSIWDSHLPPHEKHAERLAHEAIVVISAAAETTSRALSITMFYLLSNRQILSQLQDEIQKAMPNSSNLPSWKELEELPYLVATVKEALRISAMITSRMPLMAHTDLIYKDWTIPAMTPTSMTIHDILLDPNIYENPNVFDPDRWLVENPPSESYFVPFGKGTRMCQGMRFAYTELYLVLTTLLRRYEFQLHDTFRERDIESVRDCFIGEPHPESFGVRVKMVGKRA
ncbi:cytochrome P450 protein [Rutstroemia sp. NJR-2017a BBW]|nr:cytochrome P450 protein [Rutstroemia sp. NJR-2017a BBW]